VENFTTWIFKEDFKGLAKAYRSSLEDVPQDPNHHPEGNVLSHIKLVRKAIPKATEALKELKNYPVFGDILENLDFIFTSEEMQILFMSAWLHDIGKSTATTIDGIHYLLNPKPGKIQAINHERPNHYAPQIEKLLGLAPNSISSFYNKNKDIIEFLIQRHMDFAQGGFGKKVLAEFFKDGKIINDRKFMMLLVLMWADKMGRGVVDISKNNDKLQLAASRSKEIEAKIVAQKKSKFSGDREEFVNMLRKKGLSDKAIEKAVSQKFPHVD